MGTVKYQLLGGQSPEIANEIEKEINEEISNIPYLLEGEWTVYYEYRGDDLHYIEKNGEYRDGEELELVKLVHRVISKYRSGGVLL